MNPYTRDSLIKAGISADLTEHILAITDQGRKNPPAIQVESIPGLEDERIIDLSAHGLHLEIKFDRFTEKMAELGLPNHDLGKFLSVCRLVEKQGALVFQRKNLEALGLLLVPLVTFGMLNGGSATSYFDEKKNHELSPFLFTQFEEIFSMQAAKWAHRPKGLGPACINMMIGTEIAPSFLELKIRAWLLLIRRYQKRVADLDFKLPWNGLEREMPFFQMVSSATGQELAQGWSETEQSKYIKPLAEACQIKIDPPLTATQEMVAAFTLPLNDGSRDIFFQAYGKPDNPLGLPGGHGQNFHVLSRVYRQLHSGGKMLAYLGNIDNIGYLPDTLSIAISFLQDCDASFEFAFKTPLDRKGGILLNSIGGKLTCGDIGQAVSIQQIQQAESIGCPILFNCATGLFKLAALCPQLERIARELPVRFSNQDKDAGKYSQAEQTTWEVIGLLENPLIFGVAKQERFLAAKLFLDCLLTSGLGRGLIAGNDTDRQLLALGDFMNQGLSSILTSRYGLVKSGQGWMIPD